jgi:hypothetical protein
MQLACSTAITLFSSTIKDLTDVNFSSSHKFNNYVVPAVRYKENNGGEREAGHHRHHREEKTTMVWPRQEDARGETTELNFGMGTRGEGKKGTSWKNVDGRGTHSHDRQKFITKSVEKQGGMAFGLWETATAVIEPDT